MHRQITILAPGLLGASVGLAAHQRGLSPRIAVWARRPEVRLELERQEWCHAVFSTPEEACAEASLVVICAPVGIIVPLITQIRDSLPEGSIVTDVGSVKGNICRFSHSLMPTGRFFVGSHPMAGSDRTGMGNASAELFEKQTCFVTPLRDETEVKATEIVVSFWDALGCEVATIDPDGHDEIVARISHLPHALASVLCSYLTVNNPAWGNFAGSGLKDTTRIAGGSPDLWKDIFKENQDEILRAIRQFQNELEAFQAALANNDFFAVAGFLERGKEYRDRLRPK